VITPSLEDLLERIDNRYALVATAAKRARQIINENGPNADGAIGAVSTALDEILQGKVFPEQPSNSNQ